MRGTNMHDLKMQLFHVGFAVCPREEQRDAFTLHPRCY